MLIVTLSYDIGKKTGSWGVMSEDAQAVNLLDVAQALAWAQWDVLTKLVEAQVEIKQEE